MFHEWGSLLPASMLPCPNIPLPGIDRMRTDLYVTPFFGASREYADGEGWRTIASRKTRMKARHKARARTLRQNLNVLHHHHQSELEVTEEDEYY
jgi:hypothetical protein